MLNQFSSVSFSLFSSLFSICSNVFFVLFLIISHFCICLSLFISLSLSLILHNILFLLLLRLFLSSSSFHIENVNGVGEQRTLLLLVYFVLLFTCDRACVLSAQAHAHFAVLNISCPTVGTEGRCKKIFN